MPASQSFRTPQPSALRKIDPTFHRLRMSSRTAARGRRSIGAPGPEPVPLSLARRRSLCPAGRAVIRRPKAFLFDEPLSNLDAKLRVQTRTEIARLHQQFEGTTIYVTHDQAEAMTLADRIVVLNAGEIMQVGAPAEIYGAPKNLFVAGFVGVQSGGVSSGTTARGFMNQGA